MSPKLATKDQHIGPSNPEQTFYSLVLSPSPLTLGCCGMDQDIGAVNTVVRGTDGRLYGYNTDCDGALSAIEDGLRDAGQFLLIISLYFAYNNIEHYRSLK